MEPFKSYLPWKLKRQTGSKGPPWAAWMPVAWLDAGCPITAAPAPVAADAMTVTAPMPGKILNVKVNVGDSVNSGDLVLLLEAMKMENEVAAPCDGVVKQISVGKGAVVATGDTLLVI